MNAPIDRAERNQTVRAAVRGWAEAGWIDAAARERIEKAYPDDRRRLGPALRVVAFIFTLLAAGALCALLALVTGPGSEQDFGALALVLGIGLLAATEILRGPRKFMDAGVETATLLAGALFVWLWAILGLFFRSYAGAYLQGRFWCLSGILIFAVAAWRHGSATAAAVATGFLGALLGQFPLARLSWTVVALLLIPLALRGSESGKLSPSRRTACMVVLVMALAGLYAALHLLTWDLRFFERGLVEVELARAPQGSPSLRLLFKAATALLPPLLIAFALATRRRLVLIVGLVLGAASLVTLRFYVHLAPLWANLCLIGFGLIASALGLRRWLELGPDGERRGWTARPLLEKGSRLGLVESAVAVVAAAPASPPETPSGFQGGGGRSGGGGASAEF